MQANQILDEEMSLVTRDNGSKFVSVAMKIEDIVRAILMYRNSCLLPKEVAKWAYVDLDKGMEKDVLCRQAREAAISQLEAISVTAPRTFSTPPPSKLSIPFAIMKGLLSIPGIKRFNVSTGLLTKL